MANWQVRCCIAGAGLMVVTGVLFRSAYDSFIDGHLVIPLIEGLSCIIFSMLALASLHIAFLNPPRSHTLFSLVALYLLYAIIGPVIGKYFKKKLQSEMTKPQHHQDETLMKILKINGDTLFARDYGLDKIKSREEFRGNFPLTDFAYYDKYVQRILKGEKNVMTSCDVKNLCFSSGTTGKSKLYPVTETSARTIAKIGLVTVNVRLAFQRKCLLGREFLYHLAHRPNVTECGIVIRTLFSARKVKLFGDVNTTAVSRIYTEAPSQLVQAVLSLREPDLVFIYMYSSDLAYAFFKSLERNKDILVKAIAAGCIEPYPGLDEDIRQEINQHLTPMPERAEEVRLQLNKGSDRLCKRLWAKVEQCFTAKSGSFANSAKLLANSYLKGMTLGIGLHVATEGVFNLSMTVQELLDDIYTVAPSSSFFEFIKLENMEKENPPTLLLEELEVGEQYEMVITNFDGLYRNRFGDVIKVVGYTGKTPKYQFQYRTGQILNCSFDRTPEKVLYDAVQLTESQWNNVSIRNYTSCESMHMEDITGKMYEKNHYFLFFETEEDIIVSEGNSSKFESNLLKVHDTYRFYRNQESIGQMEVIQVKAGSFDTVREIMMGARTNTQFKSPRVARRPDVLKSLWQNRITTDSC